MCDSREYSSSDNVYVMNGILFEEQILTLNSKQPIEINSTNIIIEINSTFDNHYEAVNPCDC